jgi:3',5'-cyclic-AMP phosphodiesterase
MTRFVYLADTHWGAHEMGYQMQQGYPRELPRILQALEEWMAAGDGIDFVLHGGDMVDRGNDDSIRAAAEAFQLSVPVYLCLGNHDLTEAGGVDRWAQLAPGFFGKEGVDYAIETGDCVVHVMPNQWGPSPYRWEDQQDPHFLDPQLERLGRRLEDRADAVHLIVTHSPVHGVPAAQTGSVEPFHAPPSHFTSLVTDLCGRHQQIRCVLGAHSHVNMNVKTAGVHYVIASSLVETPFEFKLFEIEATGISMRTVSLLARVGFDAVYDFDRTFVQGREGDRGFARDAG